MQINSPGLEKEAIQICGGSSGIWKTYRQRIQRFMTKRRGVLRKRQAASSGEGLPGEAVADQDVSEAGSPVPIRGEMPEGDVAQLGIQEGENMEMSSMTSDIDSELNLLTSSQLSHLRERHMMRRESVTSRESVHGDRKEMMDQVGENDRA